MEGKEDGKIYDGEWKADKWHGQGELKFNEGGRYVGEFKNHKLNGHGRVRTCIHTSVTIRFDSAWDRIECLLSCCCHVGMMVESVAYNCLFFVLRV
jgi:hypothetical protein